MPNKERLSGHVTWYSRPIPRWRRALRWVPFALALVLSFAFQSTAPLSGPDRVDPPLIPEDAEPLGWLQMSGVGEGVPSAYPSKQLVAVYLDRATVTPGLEAVVLPLNSMKVVSARPVGVRWTRRKDLDALWELNAEGAGNALTFRGRWLLLGQLGTLGDWSEPR